MPGFSKDLHLIFRMKSSHYLYGIYGYSDGCRIQSIRCAFFFFFGSKDREKQLGKNEKNVNFMYFNFNSFSTSFQALRHFMKSPSTEDNLAIEMAIETVSNFDKTKYYLSF